VFPGADAASMTVAVERGGIEASATSYGNPVTFTSEERPALAVDGDEETAWRTGAFSDARGERLELTLAAPTTTDRVTLLQPTRGVRNRYITEVRLRFDDADPITVGLSPQSREAPGQVVNFPERTFTTLSIEIIADTAGELLRYAGQSSLGFAEVRIGDDPPTVDEAIRVPTDLLDAAGADSIDHPLSLIFTRIRHDPTDVTRDDEEFRLSRLVTLPAGREFALTGDARLSPRAESVQLDELLGRDHDDDVPWVRASSSLTGSFQTPAAAFDGDPDTAWSTARADPARQWVEVVLPEPVTFGELPLTIVADGLHSVPTELEIWVDGEVVGRVPVPEITDGDRQGATTTVDVSLPEEVTGSRVRLRMTGLRTVTTNDWVGDRAVGQPVAIAEIGLPGERVADLPKTFDSGCREDLVEIDGSPVPVRVRGPMPEALGGAPLDITSCDGGSVELGGGEHELRTARGRDTAIDIDRLVLRSAPGGDATDDTSASLVAEVAAAGGDEDAAAGVEPVAAPTVEVLDQGHDHVRARVADATPGESFWLVMGQSHNDGWTASADGATLEEPQLVDGFANGWRVVPASSSFEVEMRFAPQQRVDVALVVSGVAAIVCLLLVLRRPRTVVLAPASMPEPYSPVLAFRYDGALPSRRTAVLTGAGMGVVAFALAGPLVGLGIGIAAGVGARHETFRRWLLLASPLALGLAALYVLYNQVRHSPMASFDWPIVMRRPSPLGWIAVLILVADAVVDRVWQSRRSDDG
jgi:arabinofuranan 3-O-arabinosyltransferase